MGQPSEPKPASDRPAVSAIAAVGVLVLLVGLSVWVLWSEPPPPAIVRTASPSSQTEPEPATPELPPDLGPVPAIPLARTPFEPASKSPSTNPAFTPITGLPSAYLAGLPNADPALVAWLKAWEQRSMEGQKTTPEQIAELTKLLEKSDLPFGPLYGLGRSLDDVEGATVSQPFYAVAVSRAEGDMKKLPPRGEQAKAYYWPLTAMIPSLDKARDYVSSQKCWQMQAEMADPRSNQEYICRFMASEMLLFQHQFDLAEREYQKLAQDYDDGKYPSSPRLIRAEVDYSIGIALYFRGEYEQAADRLAASVRVSGKHRSQATQMMALSLARLGRFDAARQVVRDHWKAGFIDLEGATACISIVERVSREPGWVVKQTGQSIIDTAKNDGPKAGTRNGAQAP